MSDHVIGITGFASGLPGLIETCIHGGEFFVARLITYRQSDQRIADFLQMFSLHWDFQKDALKKLARLEQQLDDDVKERFVQVLESLRRLLEKATATLSKYTMPPTTQTTIMSSSVVLRLRYALVEESVLSSLERDISAWENRFVMRLAVLVDLGAVNTTHNTQHPSSDDENMSIRIPLLRPADKKALESYRTPEHMFPIQDQAPFEKENPNSDILRTANPTVLVERYEALYSQNPEDQVQSLAASLCSAEPELMHILPCRGYTKYESGASFYGLQFAFPRSVEGLKPKSLRSLLLEKDAKHPLNDRIRIANELATAVWYIHSGGFVHKSIRPETILIFIQGSESGRPQDECFPWSLGPSFLAGFSRFRREENEFASKRAEDNELSRYCYRHPQRWGAVGEARFSMLHDIYSLGVILLEVGLWRSLLDWENPKNKLPSGLSALLRGTDITSITSNPSIVQSKLIETAKRQLPRAMGNRYTSVVVSCLSCVEGGLTTSSKGLSDRSPTLAYMESVVERLESIRL